MEQTDPQVVVEKAVDRLMPFAQVILMSLSEAQRYLGRTIERKEFVQAKAVYATLRARFMRDDDTISLALLESFLRDPQHVREKLIRMVQEKAELNPAFARDLQALTSQW